MRTINLIVIHCSATPAAHDIGRKEIDRMHRQRGFLRIGYHYVIRRNGAIEPGRELSAVGAHVEGHNANSIGVCMVGGLTPAMKPENNFTQSQWASLAVLVSRLNNTYPAAAVVGHRDLPNVHKDCPCFDVKTWLASLTQGTKRK